MEERSERADSKEPRRIDNADFRGAEIAMQRAGQVAIARARAIGREPVTCESVSSPSDDESNGSNDRKRAERAAG